MMDFKSQLECLLNKTSQENASNTPDFILAQYLNACLTAFNIAVQQRDTWHGRDASPSTSKELGAKGKLEEVEIIPLLLRFGSQG